MKNFGVYKQLVSIIGALLLGAFQITQAQNKIIGNIVDGSNDAAVIYANVALLHLPDSSLVTGVATNEHGQFAFENVSAGSYCVKASFVGYAAVVSPELTISDKTPVANVGMIQIQPDDTQLEEIVISDYRVKTAQSADRTAYIMNEQIIAASASGADLLRKIPSVSIDFDNNIALQGSKKVLILVDGRERDAKYVTQINPESVQKIEVLTNPSVRYGGEYTGVINIVLRRDAKPGYSGNFILEVPLPMLPYSNTSGNFDYGYKKIHLSLSGLFMYRDFDMYRKVERRNTINGVAQQYLSEGEGHWNRYQAMINYGVDYFLNDKNTFNFYGKLEVINMPSLIDYKNSVMQQDTLSNYFTSFQDMSDKSSSNFSSLFYKRTFDTPGQELTTDISFYTYGQTMKEGYGNTYYKTDKTTQLGSPVLRNDLSNNTRNTMSVKVDYTHPITEKLTIETGYMGYVQMIDNKYDQKITDASTFGFGYNEKRHSGYISSSATQGKFMMQAGVRLENSAVAFDTQTLKPVNTWLPNASVRYNISQAQSVKLAFSRNITRPLNTDLNPYVSMTDSMSVTRGNPNLLPQLDNKLQLSYSLEFAGQSFTPEIYAIRRTDVFHPVTRVNNNNIAETFTFNAAQGTEVGAALSGAFTIAGFWMINPYFKLYHTAYEANTTATALDLVPQKKLTAQVTLESVTFLPGKFLLINYWEYTSRTIDAQGVNRTGGIYLLALDKMLMKNKARVGIYYYAPFYRRYLAEERTVETKNLYNFSNLEVDIRNMITLRFSYRFGGGKDVKKLERETIEEKESNKKGL